jgi:hypothetical protein
VAYENLVDAAETIVRGFSEVLEPGRFWVDIFPILRYVPAWFPGAGWKRKLKGIEEVCKQVRQGTFDDAMERAVSLSRNLLRLSCGSLFTLKGRNWAYRAIIRA